jgi:hypothetical protein
MSSQVGRPVNLVGVPETQPPSIAPKPESLAFLVCMDKTNKAKGHMYNVKINFTHHCLIITLASSPIVEVPQSTGMRLEHCGQYLSRHIFDPQKCAIVQLCNCGTTKFMATQFESVSRHKKTFESIIHLSVRWFEHHEMSSQVLKSL